MTELGNRLKEARLAKGLSLDDLQELTKIQKRYLLGIEEGNYNMMPGKFYVRAFIKQYAEAVGLEPESLFEEFKSEVPNTVNEELPNQLSRVKTKKSISNNHSKMMDILPKIIIAIVVIGIFVFVWYIAQKNAGNSTDNPTPKVNDQDTKYEERVDLIEKEQPVENDKKATDNEKDQNEDLQDNKKRGETVVPKQELALVESNGRNSTYELKNAETFNLKIVSNGKTWISVNNNQGKSFFAGNLEAGDAGTQTFDLTQETEIKIVAGNTIDTEIFINDQKLEYAVQPTDHVRQDIIIRYVKPSE